MATKPKRPRDPFQLAKLTGDISTGEVVDEEPDAGKSESAIKRGHLGGIKGGEARAKKLTAERRSEIAKKAAQGRWKN